MVHPQALGRNLRKEERNKWGFLEAIAARGKPFMPEIPCRHIPSNAYLCTGINDKYSLPFAICNSVVMKFLMYSLMVPLFVLWRARPCPTS
jgi:hypothetical protein